MATNPQPSTALDLSDGEEDENYHSASDEDFDPTIAPTYDDNHVTSSDDEEATQPKSSSGLKRKNPTGQDGSDLDFSNSGDEGIIKKGRRKAKKSGGHGDEDEGGEGGLIKTRAQRKVEQVERKPLASTATATVDVDKLWAELNSIPVGKSLPPASSAIQKGMNGSNGINQVEGGAVAPARVSIDEEMITVSRTYAFAGEKTTELKRVPKSSAEAQLWLSQQGSNTNSATALNGNIDPTKPPLRRPLKRRSMFDDDPPVAGATNGSKKAEAKAGKLTTVEKSKLDWAGYVDKEGIAEELGELKKGKTGYLNRMDFLGRVENRKEEERRAAKRI